MLTPLSGLGGINRATVALPQLRDASHVDGIAIPAGAHLQRSLSCVDGRNFYACTCGWVREFLVHPPDICAVGEAERERTIALWCAEKRIDNAKARGERDAMALQQAMAAERR